MARPRTPRRVARKPFATYYKPQGIPMCRLEESVLGLDGFEALRLVDASGLDQEAAARMMGVSKPTLCRILAQARSVVAGALVNGRALRISGGDYVLEGAEGCGPGGRCRQAKPQPDAADKER